MSTSLDDNALEHELQARGLTAPRLTPAQVEAKIVSEVYRIMPSGRAMVCELTLRNGFTVYGHSATVSAANFREDIARRVSRNAAVDQIWPLEGYLLAEDLFRSTPT